MKNIMLDLETMSTASNAAIVAIGAVKFDLETGQLGDTFYRNVDLQSCINAGLHVNGDTVMWWMSQSEAARDALTADPYDLSVALNHFSYFCCGNREAIIWGNGSDFDNVILANAYRAMGPLAPPWKFYNNRCYRTMKSMRPGVVLQRRGTHHNALDDAITQAEHLVLMCT